MRKISFTITLLVILFAFDIFEIKGQIINSIPKEEKVSLFTDRTLYVAGEHIQFAAFLYNNGNFGASLLDINNIDLNELIKNIKSQNHSISDVIYIELITPDGEKISAGKYRTENSFSSGCLFIPKDILNGIYYLRAYTKLMRNYGARSYCYISLKIINPDMSNILSHNYTKNTTINSITIEDTLTRRDFITLTIDRKEYSTRDRVNIRIKANDLIKNQVRGLTLTVIPDYSIIGSNQIEPISDISLIKNYYYPETKGLSLTGKLKDNKTNNPLPNTTVNLSILGDCKDFMAVNTDSLGRFFFKMPDFKGIRDIFLSTEATADSKSTILIDNDFCQNKIVLPTPVFQLTEIEKKLVCNLAQNMQIASHFTKKEISDSVKYFEKPFYGEPQEKLYFDKYISLPTIEDYVNELIPMLKIRKQDGKKYFRIYSTKTEMNIFKPLVLLDLIAIDNPEKILSLPPQNISHIEIVNTPYVKGNITYGGIISIYSKKGDFGGIDLPTSGVFIDFTFFADCKNIIFNEILKVNQPDFRNTLLWEPNIILNSNSFKDLSFTTSDSPGKYIVVLRGITSTGEVLTSKKSFIVK